MQIEKLSDQQLYASLYNPKLSHEIKELLKEEFNKRNFSIGYIDELALTHEKPLSQEAPLSLKQKFFIVIFPWIIPLQAILANKHLATSNKRKWESHWTHVAIGIALWTIVLVVVSRFYFSSNR